MTISKNEPWGWPATDWPPSSTVDTDAGLALTIQGSIAAPTPIGPVGLSGGDLFKTVGGVVGQRTPTKMCLPVDLGIVEVDGVIYPFAAHVIARGRSMWASEQVVAMNAAWCGELNLGPKAHPNDGLLDFTIGGLPTGQRRMASKRARSGTHVPHPDLRVVRSAELAHEGAPLQVFVDGQYVGRGRSLRFSIIVDAGVIAI